MSRRRALLIVVSVATLVTPRLCEAQAKDDFLRALVDFTNAVSGVYGDEGPALLAAVDAMDAGLTRWDAAVARVEAGFASQITAAAAPAAARMRAALGSVYLDQRRLDAALAQFEQSAALDPQFADVQLLRGFVHQAANRRDAAASAFREAWQRDRTNAAHAYLFLSTASAAAESADTAAALAALTAAVERATTGAPLAPAALLDEASVRGPLFLGARYAPAVRLIADGRFRDGVARLRELALADSLVSDVALRSEEAAHASAALRRSDGAAAIAAATMLTERYPSSAEAHRLLGVAFWIDRRFAQSLQALRNAVRLDPSDERSRLTIADVLVERADIAGGRASLAETTQAIPDSGLAHWKLATLAQTQADDAAGLAALQAATSLPTLGGAGHLLAAVGRLHHRQLDLDAAVAAYRSRLLVVPNDALAHVDLGDVWRAQEKLPEALAEYLAAALIDPASAQALAMAGIVQASAGRDADAVRMLRKAVASDPSHLEARYALSRALLRTGEGEAATRELAVFQQLQAKAMEDERRRYRENQAKIDAALGAVTGGERSR